MRKVANLASAARQEQGVALLSAILFMVLMAGISVVLVGVVVAQSVPSNIAQKSTKTIYAAQTGMQTALAIIRSAAAAPDYAGNVYGDPTKLPCATTTAPLTGKVNAQSDGITYSVVINYYTLDPTGKDSTWLGSNKLSCSSTTGVASTPKYAAIISQGIASTVAGLSNTTLGNRTLSAIYGFKVTNVNIPGGRIYDINKGYCLRGATATVGSLVNFIAAASCTNDALELWVYDTDYKIKLASTIGSSTVLCITGPVSYGGAAQDAKLQPCKSNTDPLRWNQLWSWMGSDTWQGQNQTISSGYSNSYLGTGYATGTALVGKNLQVLNVTTFVAANGPMAPTTQVGAGAAGYNTHQIVNYKEFGRCADVTGQNIGSLYMISYPCKQDPSGPAQTNLFWNHKWYYSEPTAPATTTASPGQQIYVYYNNNTSTKYCLTRPTGSGTYPVFTLCSGDAKQNWTRVNDTGTYASSYLFLDAVGRCLTVDPTDLYASTTYSKLKVATCDGSDAQKWNAPSSATNASVASFKEGP